MVRERSCDHCGATLRRRRVDARWCSDACRKAAARAPALDSSQAFWQRLAAIRRKNTGSVTRAARRPERPDKARTRSGATS